MRRHKAVKLRVKAVWALGEASVEEIDRLNILHATCGYGTEAAG